MNNDKMVFNIQAYGKSVTIEVSDDLMIYDFLDHCRDLALSMGYDMDTWKTGVIEMAEYYMEEEEKQVEKNLRDYGNYTEPKVYTGKSGLTVTWQDKPTKEYTDWIKKNIPDSNC